MQLCGSSGVAKLATVDEEWDIVVARALAFANNMLKSGLRYAFVSRYLSGGSESAFVKQYDKHSGPVSILLMKVLLMFVFTAVAPFGYGNLIMRYPCKHTDVLIRDEVQGFEKIGCDAQDWIKSPQSLILGPLAIIAVMIMGQVMLRLRRLRITAWVAMSYYRLEDLIAARIWKLKYHKSPAVCGVTAQIYYMLVAEMVVVSVMLRSGVAAVVGLAVGELFLQLANVVLAPSDKAIALIKGKLISWTQDPSARPLLVDLSNTVLRTYPLSRSDFLHFGVSLSEGVLMQLHEDVRMSAMFRTLGWFFRPRKSSEPIFWESLPIQCIIIAEDDKLTDISGIDVDSGSDEEESETSSGDLEV